MTGTAVGGWTDERVDRLRQLWSEGLSASQIAVEIGGVSRNAVIGKVHRLGLAGRAKAGPEAAQPQRTRRVGQADGVAPAPETEEVTMIAEGTQAGAADGADTAPVLLCEDVPVPASERVTIMELRESMCRWPIGDPTSAEFRFCGGRAITGLPYCPHHAQIAYQPVADRRRDRRVGGGRL